MIALCSNHAAKADGDYYEAEYLSELKRASSLQQRETSGAFDYMRRDLIVFIGSQLFYDCETLVQINGERCVYFNRDDDGYLLLNFKMPSLTGSPRAWLEDNVWTVDPGANSVECPPRGRHLKVHFANGDMFYIEFRDVNTEDDFVQLHPDHAHIANMFTFPATIASLYERSQNGIIEFGQDETKFQTNKIVGGAIIDCQVGISLGGFQGFSSDTLRMLSAATSAFNGSRGRRL
ncbi:hypothetical protein [Allobranchiibius sp. GilTou38]|uniref:hypothetical protein n=1 Tax=Allobranchiibius sp. GilTou38 TaxID=2815210 RepID=UPI001AA18306|nr:hypothetical protein [Allobranchiibius sp. GilTou38]MBO1765776.1 hypothetical protein [Allobranchiibius sp. GilTou38]